MLNCYFNYDQLFKTSLILIKCDSFGGIFLNSFFQLQYQKSFIISLLYTLNQIYKIQINIRSQESLLQNLQHNLKNMTKKVKHNNNKYKQDEESQQQIQQKEIVQNNFEEEQDSQNEDDEYVEDQDQLKQEVAFHFDIDEPEATEQEKLAYQYMQFVKTQKQKLKQDRKKLNYPTSSFYKSEQKLQQEKHSLNNSTNIHQKPSWLQQFQQECYTHWSCIIQNIKYLINKNGDYQQNQRKKNKKMYETLQMKQNPMIYELTNLTIGEIQQLMVKFSKQVHQIILDQDQNHQLDSNFDGMIKNYNLWIYSLLALHQSWANYKHFQSIGQVNSVVEQLFTKNLIFSKSLQSENEDSILITLVLLIRHFQQKHMAKFMNIYIQKQNQFNKEHL